MVIEAVVDPLVGKSTKSMVVKLYSDQNSWKPALSNLALPPVNVSFLCNNVLSLMVLSLYNI